MADENENLLEVSFKLGQAFPELKTISQALNCSICYRPFKSPTLTKCNHTFCSFCVRSYCSSGRQSCPICFKNICETDLRSLKFLTELQKAFTKHFAKLKVMVKKINVQDLLEDEVVEKEEEDSRLSSVSEASGSTSPVYPTMITKEINSEPSTSFATSDTVSCPVCLTLVLKKNINHHLDNECKPIQKKEDIVKGKTRKKLPMPVFHLLKDSDIKKRLKEQGIDTKVANRKGLEQRLKNFIILWNSQCDEENPLSRMEIVMKVKEEELAKAKSVSNSVSQLIQYNAKSDPSFIDQMQAKLRKDNKDQFALLVQQAKASKGKRNVNKEANENIQTVNLTQQNQVQLTPKRKIAEDENEEELQEEGAISDKVTKADNALGKALDKVTTPQRKRPFFGTPKPITPRIPCPICFVEFPETFIQSHAERCLDKPQPRGSGDDPNTSYDLLSVTPEIIEASSPDFICSTPQRKQDDEARSSSSPQLNIRPKRGEKKPNSSQAPANAE